MSAVTTEKVAESGAISPGPAPVPTLALASLTHQL